MSVPKLRFKEFEGDWNLSSLANISSIITGNTPSTSNREYYDGEFLFAYYNIGTEDLQIKKGEIIGQVVFQKFLVVDNDNASGERTGGFGSTGKGE